MAILIVDDEPDMREFLRFVLEAHGHNDIRTASNGREALELLSATASPVDVILTEINMPGLSGADMCHFVKKTLRLHDIPILVITAMSDQAMIERAFAAGAHDVLPKPVGPMELVTRVNSALNWKRELDRGRAREKELLDLTRRLERVNNKLRRLSVLDELTGVPNRRFLNLVLQQEWGRSAREHLPLSLVMIDIDYFKSFNDIYGHPAGDVCLTTVAKTLQALIRRPGDAITRYGGEEFVAMLANTDLHGAYTVAEGLRKSVEELGRQHAGSPLRRVTISLGVACAYPDPSLASGDLLQAADQAVYRAKAAGKNCVEMWEESVSTLSGSTIP